MLCLSQIGYGNHPGASWGILWPPGASCGLLGLLGVVVLVVVVWVAVVETPCANVLPVVRCWWRWWFSLTQT